MSVEGFDALSKTVKLQVPELDRRAMPHIYTPLVFLMIVSIRVRYFVILIVTTVTKS